MNEKKRQKIAYEVIKVLKSRFESFPQGDESTRNAPFHKVFLNAFSHELNAAGTSVNAIINMSSWMHGLNTTLGLSFFENVARILCCGEKRTFKDNIIYRMQSNSINELLTDLKNADRIPDVIEEENMLDQNARGEMLASPNFTVDCFFEDNENVVAIELKSVRPNSGEVRGEKQKLLLSRAALKARFPGKRVVYYFGFPFDPLADTEVGYDKARFMGSIIEFSKFCAPDEILLADEMWSFLSGESGTMASLLTQIRDIATPSFMELFEFISNPGSILNQADKYADIAARWSLYDEALFAHNVNRLSDSSDNNVLRALNACSFGTKGAYNYQRAETLKRALGVND